MARTNIKHPRRLVDLSAPASVDIWLLLNVVGNQDDINDTDYIKEVYKERATAIYGKNINFSTTMAVVRSILNGGNCGSGHRAVALAAAKQIENPMLTYIR